MMMQLCVISPIPTPRLTFNCSTLWLLSSTTKIRKSSRCPVLAVGRTELLTSLQRPKPSRPNCAKEFPKPRNVASQEEPVQWKIDTNWLVVSTHLKNISQIGNLPQVGVKIKNIWNHHLANYQLYPVVSWVKILNSTYRMEIGSYWTTIQVDHQGVSGWNALTWWSTFGLRGLGISDPTWKRKNLPLNKSCNSTSSHPIWVIFATQKWIFSNCQKLPEKCFKKYPTGSHCFRSPYKPEYLQKNSSIATYLAVRY